MSVIDTRESRLADLAIDNNNKDSLTGNKVVIYIDQTIPILDISPDLIINNNKIASEYISTATAYSNFLVDVEYKNTTGNDRFLILTKAISGVTKNISLFYYDRKYNDIIIVGELAWIPQDITGLMYDLKGKRLGGGKNHGVIPSDLSLPVDDVYKLVDTNEDINNTTYHLTLNGLNTHTSASYYLRVDADTTIRSDRLALSGMVSLGSITDIFTQSISIPTYTVYQISHNRFAVKYTGNRKPNNIYVPLNF